MSFVTNEGLCVKNLACVRNGRIVFKGIDFSLGQGEVLHVHGANGVGKSSLLRAVSGLLEPAEGEVHWLGRLSSADPIAFRRSIGYLGHKLGLKDRLTVAENVKLLMEGGSSLQIDEALERLGVLKQKNHLCETLSAGQKQRVALARLLAKKSTLWLLDEPFTAVDSAGIDILDSLIVEHVKAGGMVLLTSHQLVKLTGVTVKTLAL